MLKVSENVWKIVLNTANPTSELIPIERFTPEYRQIHISDISVFDNAKMYIKNKSCDDIDCISSYQKLSFDSWDIAVSFASSGNCSLDKLAHNSYIQLSLIDELGSNTGNTNTNIIVYISY